MKGLSGICERYSLHNITWHDIESSFLWCWSYVVQLVASTNNNITIRFLCCSNRHRQMVTLTQYSMQFLYSFVREFSHLINIMIKTVHILKVCQSVFESVSLNGSKLTHFLFTRELSLQSLGYVSSRMDNRVNVSSYAFTNLRGQVWTRQPQSYNWCGNKWSVNLLHIFQKCVILTYGAVPFWSHTNNVRVQ